MPEQLIAGIIVSVRNTFFNIGKNLQNWLESLIVLKAETIVGWHKKVFRLFWRWKSMSKNTGRQRINHEIRSLIGKMAIADY